MKKKNNNLIKDIKLQVCAIKNAIKNKIKNIEDDEFVIMAISHT
jgi:hypothetical protein